MSVKIYIDIIVIIYFYTIFHDLMWVTFEFIWLKCYTFSIIQAVMRALIPKILQKVSHTQGCKPF